MKWNDDAVLLSAKPFGENGLLVTLLTAQNGRHGGFVPGGQSRRNRALWQSGNHLAVEWKARLADQLGSIKAELLRAHAPRWLDDPSRLAALSSACAMSELCLPDHVPNPQAFAGLLALLDGLTQDHWGGLYVHWELGLLATLGFGLDLARCAVSGGSDDLAFVSPRSGRAVSRAAAGPYRDRLLLLPQFLLQGGVADSADLAAGLALTGYFLERHVLAPQNRSLPAARSRLVDRLRA